MPSYSHSESDEVNAETWQKWENFLMPFMKQYSNGTRASPTEVVFQLHDMALELRDKLRLTLSKLAVVRSDLADVENQLFSERQNYQIQARAYESELQSLRSKILSQEDILSQLNCELVVTKDENGSLKSKLYYVEAERHKLSAKVEQLMITASAATDEALNQQAKSKDIFRQLLATKEEVASLSATEALLHSAKEELQRLDKENKELRDVVMNGKLQMGRSRILEGAGISDAFERIGGGSTNFAMPHRLAPSHGRSQSAPRSRSLIARSDPSTVDAPVDDATNLAFIGPPNSAYPPDPENYQFYRVGGGFTPLFDLKNPTLPKPRASGWVPKDIVRLVQAFRHSYKLKLEWPYWEPLILMVDEIYRTREARAMAALKQTCRDRVRSVKRQIKSTMPYPTIVANDKISHLRQQLASSQRALEKNAYEDNVMRRTTREYPFSAVPFEREESPDFRKNLGDLNYAFENFFRNPKGALLSGDSSEYSYSD